MFDWWRAFRETVDETTSNIRWCLGVVAMIGTITVIIGRWLSTLNTIQIVALYVVLGCLVIIGITYFVDWRRKKSVENIPELLAKIDQLTLQYIEAFDPPSKPEQVSDNLAKMLGLNTTQLKAAMRRQDQEGIELEYEKVMRQYQHKFANPSNKAPETIQNLLYMSAFLNDNEMGLKQVTATAEYQRLQDRVRMLQRMVPSPNINMKINDYWRWSEGLYCVVLTTRPFLFLPGIDKSRIPPKVRAANALMRPTVEQQTALLISTVRESIEQYKERNKRPTDVKEDKGKSKR